MKLLLDAGADINKRNRIGWTPLHAAVYNDNEACTKLLLEAGADKDKADNDGLTALSLAAKKGYYEIVNLLLYVTYNDIADKVLIAISKQDIIFDTAFIIFKKTVEETITFEGFNIDDDSEEEDNIIEGFNIDDPDTHKKLYNVFQAKFSEYTKK